MAGWGLDKIILEMAITCFILFLIIHVVTFRYMNRQKILSSLCQSFVLSWLLGGMCFIVGLRVNHFFGTNGLGIVFFETLIYGLLCFLYVLYVFGPFESSIRFRLIYELYQNHPQGMSKEEIEKRYNADVFLRRRLARLLASGDLVLEGEVYRLKRRQNIFMLMDFVADALQKVVAKRP